MAQELDPPTLTIRLEDLREILRVDKPKLNEVAIDLCGLLGLPVAHGLVVELVSTKNPQGFRIRAAKALERVGAIDEAEWLRLAPIIFEPDPDVRDAALHAVAVIRSRKEGLDVEGLFECSKRACDIIAEGKFLSDEVHGVPG
jgi:hypothetical protein